LIGKGMECSLETEMIVARGGCGGAGIVSCARKENVTMRKRSDPTAAFIDLSCLSAAQSSGNHAMSRYMRSLTSVGPDLYTAPRSRTLRRLRRTDRHAAYNAGVIVKPHDAAAIREVISALARDPERCPLLGQLARTRAAAFTSRDDGIQRLYAPA